MRTAAWDSKVEGRARGGQGIDLFDGGAQRALRAVSPSITITNAITRAKIAAIAAAGDDERIGDLNAGGELRGVIAGAGCCRHDEITYIHIGIKLCRELSNAAAIGQHRVFAQIGFTFCLARAQATGGAEEFQCVGSGKGAFQGSHHH